MREDKAISVGFETIKRTALVLAVGTICAGPALADATESMVEQSTTIEKDSTAGAESSGCDAAKTTAKGDSDCCAGNEKTSDSGCAEGAKKITRTEQTVGNKTINEKAESELIERRKKAAGPTVTAPQGFELVLTSPADTADLQIFQGRRLPARPKIGLALGGGGARGAAHVGVLKVLEREGIKFDVITGTSIGSVVGGLYAAGVPLSEMENAFESGALMRNFMTVPLTFRLAVAPIMFVPRLFGSKSYDGLYYGNKFRTYVRKNITVHDVDIEKLSVPFAAVSLNLLDGKPYRIQKGNLGYAMQASTAVPGLRKPVDMGDSKLMVDGGVICNLPVKQCREMGADIVIAVNIDHPFGELPKQHFERVGSVAQWMLDWDLYSLDKVQAEISDVTIHPDTSKISLISRSKKDARRGLLAGEKAAEEMLPEIRKKLESVGVIVGKPRTTATTENVK